jgi:hypothetical protein
MNQKERGTCCKPGKVQTKTSSLGVLLLLPVFLQIDTSGSKSRPKSVDVPLQYQIDAHRVNRRISPNSIEQMAFNRQRDMNRFAPSVSSLHRRTVGPEKPP